MKKERGEGGKQGRKEGRKEGRTLALLWCHFGSMIVVWGHCLVTFDIESDVDVHKWWLGGAENRKC